MLGSDAATFAYKLCGRVAVRSAVTATIVLACLATAGGAIAAQPASPSGGARMRVFIAPSGKPYHATPEQSDPMRVWFAASDRNQDGAIDLAEFRAEFDAFFTELDRDGSGAIEPPEIDHYETVIAPEVQLGFGGMGDDRGGGAGRHHNSRGGASRRGGMGVRGVGVAAPQDESSAGGDNAPQLPFTDSARGASRYGLLDIPEPVASCDTDMDRRITRAEFRAAADRRFKVLDTSGDGRLTIAELPHRGGAKSRR